MADGLMAAQPTTFAGKAPGRPLMQVGDAGSPHSTLSPAMYSVVPTCTIGEGGRGGGGGGGGGGEGEMGLRRKRRRWKRRKMGRRRPRRRGASSDVHAASHSSPPVRPTLPSFRGASPCWLPPARPG